MVGNIRAFSQVGLGTCGRCDARNSTSSSAASSGPTIVTGAVTHDEIRRWRCPPEKGPSGPGRSISSTGGELHGRRTEEHDDSTKIVAWGGDRRRHGRSFGGDAEA